MKKYSKLLLVAVLFVSVLFITGCGSKEDKKDYKKEVAGTYQGKYTKIVGDDAKNTEEEFSLELNEDGTGKHNRDGESFNVEWDFDGEKFTMKDKFGPLTIDYTGTLKDGKLQIYNGDPEDIWTYEYYYEKA